MTPSATRADLQAILPPEIMDALQEEVFETQKLSLDAALVTGNTVSVDVDGTTLTQGFTEDNDTTLTALADQIAGSIPAVDTANVLETSPASDGDDRREIVVIAANIGDHIVIDNAAVTGGASQPSVTISMLTSQSYLDDSLDNYLSRAARRIARYRKRLLVKGTATGGASNKLIDTTARFDTDGIQPGWLIWNAARPELGKATIQTVAETELTTDVDLEFTTNQTYEILDDERKREAETYQAALMLVDGPLPQPIRAALGSPRVQSQYSVEMADRYRRELSTILGPPSP